jgi:flagellar biosynthesis protein FlhB
MSESSMQEKTEEATPKRRQDAREEGQIPKSQELNTAVLLLGAALVVNGLGPMVGETLRSGLGYGLTAAGSSTFDAPAAVMLLQQTGWKALAAVSAVTLAMAGLALGVAGAQGRGVVTMKPLEPKWSRLDPIKNAKQKYGVQPWAELVKSLTKMGIVALAVWVSLSAAWPEIIALAQQSPSGFIEIVRRYAVRLLLTAGIAYIGLAAADYLYQIWRTEKQMRMSKEEVKREHKQMEGDPMIKARRRAIARSFARRQMFQEVPHADVVVTNPTHRAVALKYDPERHDAPLVLAMGERKIAERIKALAAEHGVPMVENRPLARALLQSARVGTTVPPELYVAVAEVLAFVFRQRAARGGWSGSATA